MQYNITTVTVLFTAVAREDYRHFTCCGSVVATRVTARRVCDYPDSQINDTGILFTYDFTSAAKCVDKRIVSVQHLLKNSQDFAIECWHDGMSIAQLISGVDDIKLREARLLTWLWS